MRWMTAVLTICVLGGFTAEARAQVEHPAAREVEGDAVADRDVDRLDPVLGAERGAHELKGVPEPWQVYEAM